MAAKKAAPQKEKKSFKQKMAHPFSRFGMAAIVVLLLLNSFQLMSLTATVQKVDKYNQGVVDEMSAFYDDINEMRTVLLLPPKEYNSGLEGGEEGANNDSEAPEASPSEKALYQFMMQYVDQKELEQKASLAKQAIDALATSENIKEAVAVAELTLTPSEENDAAHLFKISFQDQPLFAVNVSKKDNQLFIQSILGKKDIAALVDGQVTPEITEQLSQYLSQNKTLAFERKQEITARQQGLTAMMQQNQDLASILQQKKIAFQAEPAETDEGFTYHFLNEEGAEILDVVLTRDGQYQFDDQTYEQEEQLLASLKPALEELDASTALQKFIDERRQELEGVLQETAFQDVMTSSGLSVASEPREESNKLLYDVTNSEGQVIFSFVIELSSGRFKVLQDDQETDLTTLLQGSNPDGSKKKL